MLLVSNAIELGINGVFITIAEGEVGIEPAHQRHNVGWVASVCIKCSDIAGIKKDTSTNCGGAPEIITFTFQTEDCKKDT